MSGRKQQSESPATPDRGAASQERFYTPAPVGHEQEVESLKSQLAVAQRTISQLAEQLASVARVEALLEKHLVPLAQAKHADPVPSAAPVMRASGTPNTPSTPTARKSTTSVIGAAKGTPKTPRGSTRHSTGQLAPAGGGGGEKERELLVAQLADLEAELCTTCADRDATVSRLNAEIQEQKDTIGALRAEREELWMMVDGLEKHVNANESFGMGGSPDPIVHPSLSGSFDNTLRSAKPSSPTVGESTMFGFRMRSQNQRGLTALEIARAQRKAQVQAQQQASGSSGPRAPSISEFLDAIPSSASSMA